MYILSSETGYGFAHLKSLFGNANNNPYYWLNIAESQKDESVFYFYVSS
jgi:hypothetical protein